MSLGRLVSGSAVWWGVLLVADSAVQPNSPLRGHGMKDVIRSNYATAYNSTDVQRPLDPFGPGVTSPTYYSLSAVAPKAAPMDAHSRFIQDRLRRSITEENVQRISWGQKIMCSMGVADESG